MPRNFLPPEWAPQSAVMLTWPRADGDFARHFEAVEANFVAIAVAISQHQEVHINYGLDPANLRERLIQAGAHPARLRVYRVESDDVWARDHGPITVIRDGRLVHLDFTFNGWGNKFSAERDNQLTRKLAGLGAWSAPVETVDFVLEGGGIEVDGCGALLTTERCLLAPTRNPQLTREGIEAVLKREFGIERVLWLKHGDLLGDDTDGHVDTIARFCDAHTIAYQGCSDPSDAHYEDLKGLAEELAALRTRDGSPYDLVELPLPAPIYDEDGQRLPAGYANFLIMNNVVLVPIYDDANDEPALSKLREVFEDRQVIGIDCRALILQYGGLHCVTMQIPQAPARG
ncbi:agmatine/peptidylarginine deiminase [Hydrocarboniphaga effusa]|uniref:agmatine deiminase family protein n=1 Tax=Hydrocarboniphaga effusa TaxID=243629 RepID=UPI00398BFD49